MTAVEGAAGAPAFRPSAYTAAVLRQLLLRRERVRGARVLDVGCGGGVLLAAAAACGASEIAGVDVEPDALEETRRTLAGVDPAVAVDIVRGDLFSPLGDRRFDVVLANLPHFPMDRAPADGRHPSWSAGGADGRLHLDPFLDTLADHLAPGGWALLAHNAFVGADRTRARAAAAGLAVRVADTLMVPLPPDKLARMSTSVLEAEAGRTIHHFGGHVFGEVLVLLLERADAGAARP